MARRPRTDARRTRIRRAIAALVLCSAVALLAGPLFFERRRKLPFARTKLPARAAGERPFTVQFTPDGERVLVVTRDALRAYVPEDLARGDTPPLFTVDHTEDGFTFDGAYAAAISGNGRELAVIRQLTKGAAVTGSELDVIAIQRSLLVRRITLEPVTSVALSFNGMNALVGTQEAELWDLGTGTRKLALPVAHGAVCGIHFSPDERLGVFGYPEKPLTTTWDLGSQATHETPAHLAPATFTEDGAHVFGIDRALPGKPGTARAVRWSPDTGESVAIDSGETNVDGVTDVARLTGGKRVVGIDDQHVIVWDLEARKLVRVIACTKPDLGKFESVTASPHGDAVVIGTPKGELVWLDLPD